MPARKRTAVAEPEEREQKWELAEEEEEDEVEGEGEEEEGEAEGEGEEEEEEDGEDEEYEEEEEEEEERPAAPASTASLERISASELATLLRQRPSTTSAAGAVTTTKRKDTGVVVVDVRDDDHIGGHIRGSLHVPSSSLQSGGYTGHANSVRTYAPKVKKEDEGRAMARLVHDLADAPMVVFHCMYSQQRGPRSALQYVREKERLEKQQKGKKTKRQRQKVYVLKGGFMLWQKK
jgi:Cdc25 family phosphatase